MSNQDESFEEYLYRIDPFKETMLLGTGDFRTLVLTKTNNMTDINNKLNSAETETKRTRLKGYDRILAAAKAMPLKDRVELVKELTRVNTEEVDGLRAKTEEAIALLKP